MDTDIPILIGAITAAFTSIMVLFFKYMTNREKQAKTEREDAAKVFREERDTSSNRFEAMLVLLGNNLNDNTRSNQEIAASTTKQAEEAEKRNGHLAELQLQSQEVFQRLADRNFHAVEEFATQTIHNQIVEHRTVNQEDVLKSTLQDCNEA